MLKRLFQNKRGVSPVLSSLLLTVVAVAAMTIATTATYVITSNLRETMSERAVIEDTWFNNETHTIDVFLRNTGKTTIHITAIYVNHTSQLFTNQLDFEIGQGHWLKILDPWVSEGLYHVNIITTRGTHLEEYATAP